METLVKDSYDLVLFLVEDDEDDQYIFQQALNALKLNIDLRIAGNGVEAIQMLTADPSFEPDYIFIDLNMPLMDGRKCIAEIHKLNKKKNTPIIIHSTANLKKDAAGLIDVGASYYFQKPDSIPGFTQILQQVLSAHLQKN